MDLIQEYVKTKKWKQPILAFVDEKCSIFDEEGTSQQAKSERKAIHKVRCLAYTFRNFKASRRCR
jgi:hypothetical protein